MDAGSVTRTVALTSGINGALFVVGALLHSGVQVGSVDEPFAGPSMMVQVVCAIVLGVATAGVFTRAAWARRVALAANMLALIGLTIIAWVAFDRPEVGAPGANALHVVRALLAIGSLVLLSRAPLRS